MISFRVEEAEMLVEIKDRFLKTKPMLAENPKPKPELGENPKTKPITDLKRDFRLLGRWLWFFFVIVIFFCDCDCFFANYFVTYVDLFLFIFISPNFHPFSSIIIQTGQWWVFLGLPCWGQISNNMDLAFWKFFLWNLVPLKDFLLNRLPCRKFF